ncbi:MAG: phytanoyl-CoA dioxygenase family protein [Armatimonadetes bacterium]|nr:phytanoyl-CoA dioxygenase family protein [Armatimonadota bacterium]MDE2207064.1 phytanoyl-CoA dioxygenase family protein [Armatimonadota bacterium]
MATDEQVSVLPDLSDAYPLDAGSVEHYRTEGHVLLRGVASPLEVAAYRPAIAAAVAAYNRETRPMEERDTYHKAFIQITNLWQRDQTVARFVLATRFAEIAARLMGVDGVRLYHDQALFKEAHGGLTPWHQDQFYWPLDTSDTVTMWMPLVDVPVEMGALTFASRSQQGGFLGHIGISDESQEEFDQYVAGKGYTPTCSAMQAGDATFHSGWTLHSAPGNSTDQVREVMTVIYFADGTRVMADPGNENRLVDLAAWLPGVAPGEPAISPLNPLLYRASS